jgi:Beta-1,3-glucanase/Carbohydrate binding module (family 6)
MAATLNIALQNRTSSSTVYAYITGQDINRGNALFLLQSDGHSPYYPASPSSTGSPLSANCAIPLGAPGSITNAVIPQIAGGRIWFSVDALLVFLLNPGPALVEPSVTNPSDPNINTVWDFCEFTFNSSQLFANITYVDFVSLAISLALTNTSGATQHVSGIPANGLDTVCSGLEAQSAADGAGWDKLIVTSSGQKLRVLSPNEGIVMNPSLFSGYYDPYVNQVWSKFTNSPLLLNTQASWGTVTGQVVGDELTFNGVGSFGKPTARDIFSCSTGPFAVTSEEMGALAARLSAAFNRSTLLIDSNQPSGSTGDYYKNPITNHYSRIVHAASLDGRGYAFPYDDVAPDGGADQSGAVNDPNPSVLTVAVGGDTTPVVPGTSAYSIIQAETYSSNYGTQTQACLDTGGTDNVGWIANGDWLGYSGVEFGSEGATQFYARVASGAASRISGLVQVALDSPTATPVGSFAIANTGGWQSWKTVPANINPVTGTHTVYLTFASGQPADFVNVNWFTFSSPNQPISAEVLRAKAAPAEQIWLRFRRLFCLPLIRVGSFSRNRARTSVSP